MVMLEKAIAANSRRVRSRLTSARSAARSPELSPKSFHFLSCGWHCHRWLCSPPGHRPRWRFCPGPGPARSAHGADWQGVPSIFYALSVLSVLQACRRSFPEETALFHSLLHKIEASPFDLSILGPSVGKLREKAIQEAWVRTNRLHQKDMADGGLQMVQRDFRHTIPPPRP